MFGWWLPWLPDTVETQHLLCLLLAAVQCACQAGPEKLGSSHHRSNNTLQNQRHQKQLTWQLTTVVTTPFNDIKSGISIAFQPLLGESLQ